LLNFWPMALFTFDKSKSIVKTVEGQAYWAKVKTNTQPIAQRPTV